MPQEYVIDDAGRHPQSGRHERRAPGGARAPGDLRRSARPQNITKCVTRCGLQVDDLILQPLASSQRGADRRRARTRRGAGRHRRRHHRHRGVHAGRDPPHRVACRSPATRSPTTSRSRCARRRPDAEEIKVKYACALAQLARAEETHPGAQRRRPSAAPAGAPDAGRGGAEALRGNLRDGAGRTAPLRLRGTGRGRHRADRRRLRAWKAWSSWPRRCSTCRCAWACRSTSPACPTWSAIRSMPPASACCSTARSQVGQLARADAGARQGGGNALGALSGAGSRGEF